MRVYRVRGPLLAVLLVGLAGLLLLGGLYLGRGGSGEVMMVLSSHSEEQERTSSRERAQVIQRQILASQSSDVDMRSTFQQDQMKKFCAQHTPNKLYQWPEGKGQPDEIYRHLLFDDQRKTLFCFVEKNGCTNMKRLMFVSVGELPVNTSQHEWVDLKYLERGIRRASFLNKSLTDEGRLHRLMNYYKFTVIRNPLERLVSSYRNKIEPPLSGHSLKFPNYIKRQILEQYRPVVYQHWLNTGGTYNISITFAEFVEYYVDSYKEHLNPHMKPFSKLCHPCNIPFDFYIHFKEYSQDVAMVIDRVGMQREHYHDKSLYTSVEEKTATLMKGYFQTLTRMQRGKLYDAMREELLLYYHLFPSERSIHQRLLGVDEQLYMGHR